MVLHRHAVRIHILGQQGPQIHVHRPGGLHLVALGVCKVDIHGHHAVVAGYVAVLPQVGLRLEVLFAAFLI